MSEPLKLTPEELRLMQLNELELLVEVERICRKNNIEYSLDAGTLLGAIRHKGFIPWDDDADVAFTRAEYERFFEACKTDLDKNRFFFQDYRTDSGYRWGYGKLRLLGTEFVRSGQEALHYKTGVCIDLFPHDNVPDGYISRRIYHFRNFIIRKCLYSELGRIAEKNLFMRLFYNCLYKIPRDFLFKRHEAIYKKTNSSPTSLICHSLYPTPGGKANKFGIPAKYLEKSTYGLYEGMQFKISIYADEFLHYMYGDYMKLPPVEKRFGPSFPSKLDLHQVTLEEIHQYYKNQMD